MYLCIFYMILYIFMMFFNIYVVCNDTISYFSYFTNVVWRFVKLCIVADRTLIVSEPKLILDFPEFSNL